VVAFFEGADGDVAVLPKPLILNPTGTEGQALINALMATELSIGWPETGLEEINGNVLDEDLNEAALRQTLSRAGCQRFV